MHLPDVAACDTKPPNDAAYAPATAVFAKMSGYAEYLLFKREDAGFDGRERRADRIGNLDEDLAAIGRRNELLADDAERNERNRQHERD